jgi:hypothetical protein
VIGLLADSEVGFLSRVVVVSAMFWWAHWDSNPEPKDSSARSFPSGLDYVIAHGSTRCGRRELNAVIEGLNPPLVSTPSAGAPTARLGVTMP